MKVAILGGGNVYALNLARHLHSLGIEHFGIGRSRKKDDAFWVEHHYPYRALHLVDHLDAYMALLDERHPDVIVNFAAQGEGAASFAENAHLYYRTNTLGLVRLVEELRHRDYLKRFVQIGSSEVYGSVMSAPAKESDPPRPTSPYSVSKAAFDQHLSVMHRIHGFPCNVVRPSNAYCPGQQLHRVIPRAIICALSGQKFELQGGGRAEKSYIHATDLSRAIMTVIEKGALGEIYNCGPAMPMSIAHLVYCVGVACDIPSHTFTKMAADRVWQDSRYWIDSSKLEMLGWAKTIDLLDGLADMVAWVKRYPALLEMDATFRIRP